MTTQYTRVTLSTDYDKNKFKDMANSKQSVSNYIAINNVSSKTNFEKVEMKIYHMIFIKKKLVTNINYRFMLILHNNNTNK